MNNEKRDTEGPMAMAGTVEFAEGVTGKAQLRNYAKQLRAKAADLETLADMLPEKPTPEQDRALFMLASDMQRYR